MATTNHHHHQCHCHPSPPIPTTTTCYCTMCCTTTHYSSPPPPPDPIVHSHPSHPQYHHHHPTQTHPYAPPQNHHNIHTQQYDYYPPPPPPQIHKKHHLFQKYSQQEDAQENPLSVNPTVSSLIHRIAALESSLRRRSKQSPGSSSLRDAAARTIQTHFRAFLVRRSVTLRHLKELAYIKSALNHLKSSVSDKTQSDSHLLSRESMRLLIKLDSIQGSDPMIRDGKRSISRELIRFLELIDEMSLERQVVSIKNVRFSKDGKKSVILQKEHKIRASGSRVLSDNERTFHANLKNQLKKINGFDESLDVGNPRKPCASQIRIGGLKKSQGVVKSQPRVQKNVSFDENGNVYRLIKSNHTPVSSDGSDDSNSGDEEVEEIGVSSKEVEEIGVSLKETEVEEENSSEMSENEMDPRKNLGTRIHHTTKKNQPTQEDDDDDEEEEEEEEEEDGFVFSAPLPAKMEYRVDSVNKKQAAKH